MLKFESFIDLVCSVFLCLVSRDLLTKEESHLVHEIFAIALYLTLLIGLGAVADFIDATKEEGSEELTAEV